MSLDVIDAEMGKERTETKFDFLRTCFKVLIEVHCNYNVAAADELKDQLFEDTVEELAAEQHKPKIVRNEQGKAINIIAPAWQSMVEAMKEGTLSKPSYDAKPLQPIENPLIQRMETNCQVVQDWVQRTDLRHLERSYLMFSLARGGEPGFKRLEEVMQRQQNYNQRVTEAQINAYKKKQKFLGISCRKLIQEGYCKNEKCNKYETTKSAFRLDAGREGGSK